jgi:ribosome-binding protein aMBF1 (putative translation factor)
LREQHAEAARRTAGKEPMMQKTNFDRYLEEQLRAPEFARRFDEAGAAWDVATELTRLRENAGMSQRELARRAGTTQQQISRLESPDYEGHSLRMLRRVARALDTQLVVGFQSPRAKPKPATSRSAKRKAARTK